MHYVAIPRTQSRLTNRGHVSGPRKFRGQRSADRVEKPRKTPHKNIFAHAFFFITASERFFFLICAAGQVFGSGPRTSRCSPRPNVLGCLAAGPANCFRPRTGLFFPPAATVRTTADLLVRSVVRGLFPDFLMNRCLCPK